MNLSIGTKIQYSCARGTLNATISNINVGPTAKPGFMNTWLTLDIPVQEGVKFAHKTQITGDDASLKMFKVKEIRSPFNNFDFELDAGENFAA